MDRTRQEVERLRREIKELRQELQRALKGRQQIGNRNGPLKLLYTLDNKTGAVAEIDYDAENDDLRITRRQ